MFSDLEEQKNRINTLELQIEKLTLDYERIIAEETQKTHE